MKKKIDILLEKTQKSWDQTAWFNETADFILEVIKDLFANKPIDYDPVENTKLLNILNEYLESKNNSTNVLKNFKAALIFFNTKEYTLSEEYFLKSKGKYKVQKSNIKTYNDAFSKLDNLDDAAIDPAGIKNSFLSTHKETKNNKSANIDELFQGIKYFCLAKIQIDKKEFRNANEYYLKGIKTIFQYLNFNEKIEYLINWSYLFVESKNPKFAESILNILANNMLPQMNHAYSFLLYILFIYKLNYNKESAMSYANILLSCPTEYLDHDEWYNIHLFCGEFYASENKNFDRSIYHFAMANTSLSYKWKENVKQISSLQDILKLSEYFQIRKSYEDKMLEIILENNLHTNHYITSLKNAYAELQKAHIIVQEYSFTDSLTNLYNRRYLWNKIGDFIDLAIKEKVPISCLIIDFDDFKKINDDYGHIEGDKFLKSSCDVIKSFFKAQDIVIRFGGEEILAILFNANKIKAINTAERLRKKIEDHKITSEYGNIIKSTISIGISSLNTISLNKPHILDKMIMEADKYMYQAKTKGKNMIIFSEKE